MCPFLVLRQTERITLILLSLVCSSIANYFVSTLALGWPTNPVVATFFTVLPFFKIHRVLVSFDHIASRIINADNCIM